MYYLDSFGVSLDFLGPVFKDSYYFYIKRVDDYEERPLIRLLRPFSTKLWSVIMIWVVISGIVSFIFYRTNKEKFGLSDACYEAIDALFNQCGSDVPPNSSLRTVSYANRIVALFLVPAYSGAIMSFIVYPNIKLPFRDVRGLAEDGSYKMAYDARSEKYNWFKFTEDPWAKIAFNKCRLNQENLPHSAEEGINNLCKDSKLTFICSSTMVPLKPKCNILKIPNPVYSAWLYIDLRSGSPYTKIFTKILRKARQSGTLNILLDRYDVFDKKEILIPNNEIDPVRYKDVASIVNIHVVLCIGSGILLLLENIISCTRKHLKTGTTT